MKKRRETEKQKAQEQKAREQNAQEPEVNEVEVREPKAGQSGETQNYTRVEHSIKTQFSAVFIAIMAFAFLGCIFINYAFLEKYYGNSKQKVLVEAFQKINKAANEGILSSDEYDVEFENICANGNMMILILDSSGEVVRTMSSDGTKMRDQFMQILFGNSEDGTREVIIDEEKYSIEKAKDQRLNADYLVLWGTLDNGNLIIIRTAVESLKKSVEISNRFFMYLAVIAVIFSGIFIWIFSGKLTKPILELSELAGRMTKLDFEAKYKGKGKNEIDRLGASMNQLSATLEETITELKIANNELKDDIEKKEQIDVMRKEFLANVTHELKTPIALVQGYAEGLKECIQDDPESRDFYCDVIIDEANKMNMMVKKLLTLNQLEFGTDTVMMERFDITEVIKGVIATSDILIRQKEVRMIFKPKKKYYVWADQFKVEEVLTNYITNALNHVANERIVEVRVGMEGELVHVSVFNSGQPIPQEDLDKIWIKFYKVDKARTREYGGSGIGLSIVKAIMDSFHRECGVNNYDNGVEFWFNLDSSEENT